MLDQLWFSMTIKNTLVMAWSLLGAAWMDVVLAVGAVVDVLAVDAVFGTGRVEGARPSTPELSGTRADRE
jgi:hypothetical protein